MEHLLGVGWSCCPKTQFTAACREAPNLTAARRRVGQESHPVVDKAARRAVSRYYQQNRFVDPAYVYRAGDAPAQTYGRKKTEGGFDSYERWSNGVPYGEVPRLIESIQTDRLLNGEALREHGGVYRRLLPRGTKAAPSETGARTTEQTLEEVGPGPEDPGPSLSEDSSPRFATRETSGRLNLWHERGQALSHVHPEKREGCGSKIPEH